MSQEALVPQNPQSPPHGETRLSWLGASFEPLGVTQGSHSHISLPQALGPRHTGRDSSGRAALAPPRLLLPPELRVPGVHSRWLSWG